MKRVDIFIGKQSIKDVSLRDAARLAVMILGWTTDELSASKNSQSVAVQVSLEKARTT